MKRLVLIILLLGWLFACAPQVPIFWQEPPIRWTRLPQSGNPILFGASVASIESQEEVIRYIDELVKGRLPGVRFYIVKYPAVLPPGHIGLGPKGFISTTSVTSYRDHLNGIVVLSWWGKEGRPGRTDGPPILPSGWTVGDAPWEIEHLVSGTSDDNLPIIIK
jgi:hypothetical protein